ncbi:MAG: F-box-like domain-containing protein [Kistimonas sp.]|nr:F-box-like domain-containing protein [Kistimonas sp.]
MAMLPQGTQPSPAPQTRPVPVTGEPSPPCAFGYSLVSRSGSSCLPACAQSLPTELLCNIFSFLPLDAHSHCALVCRHWYACVPPTRTRLARWREQHPWLPYLPCSRLALSYSSRIYPWLARQHCPLVPELQRQHHEWLHQENHLQQGPFRHQQDLQTAQQQEQTAQSFLTGLVLYSLSQQVVQARHLTLRPVPLAWPDQQTVNRCLFSHCSRWLAVTCIIPGGGINQGRSRVLHLYGYEEGSWRQQTLVGAPDKPVSVIAFTATPADRLLSAHGPDVRIWRKQAHTGDWHSSLLCRTLSSYSIYMITAMRNGDIITLSDRRRADALDSTGFLMLISLCQGDSWAPATAYFDAFLPRITSLSSRSCRLVLGGGCSQQCTDTRHINSLHFWYKDPGANSPGGWRHHQSLVEEQNDYLQGAMFSPGADLLLLRFSQGLFSLWALDAQCCLCQIPLAVPRCQPAQAGWNRLAHFRGDGRQLAVACSPHRIEFLHSTASGVWQVGDTLERPFQADERREPDDTHCVIRLSSSGRFLVWLTAWRVEIWQRDPGNPWRRVVERTSPEGAQAMPQAGLLRHGEAIWTLVADPVQSLCIHGPDTQGQLIEKGRITTTDIHSGSNAQSADGLSLLLGRLGAAPVMLHLDVPANSDSRDPDRPEHSGQ